ncbi:MAG TPA: anti-anti-sigma factor [Cyanobacteria bacterium UBA8803]|nr:anti-anti-sigma factor [Cyanobacteria bacterium UBA8803]
MTIATMNPEWEIIELSGSLNVSNAIEFQRQLTKGILSEQHPALLVDMQQVESIDSAGLIALVSAFRLAQQRKQRLSLCSIAPSIRIVFELTQLDQAFEIFDNRETFATTIKPYEQEARLIA